jgi:aminocarboxymuconate-semialdehyde decarboxylase
MTALSVNDPGPEFFGKDSAAMAVLLNDFIADVAGSHPDRFFGLAVLPFDTPDSMLREFDRAVTKLKMKGILLYSNLNGHFPDEEPFRPLFAEAERRRIPILLHPAYPTTYNATKGYEMAAGLGLMFDTTIALSRIILAGLMEKHPDLKLVCPHVGGALPYLIGRVDHQTMTLKRGAENIRHAPSEYLRRVWFDTVNPIGLAIRYAWEFSGPDKLLYASDHPWVDPQLIIDQIEGQKLPAADLAKLYSKNARALFSL